MTPGTRLFCARIPAHFEDADLRLRPIRISDSAFLKSGFNEEDSLMASGLPSPISASGTALRRWIKKTYDLAWCVEIRSRPAGFAGIYRLMPGESAEVSLIVFDRTLRRRGYGGRVLRVVADTVARRARVKKLFVSVVGDNRAALSFWRKMGFEYSRSEKGVCIMTLDMPHPGRQSSR